MTSKRFAVAPFALALAFAAAMPIAAQAAQGLSGSYYTLPATGPGANGGPGSVAKALSDISGLKPAATFTATTLCFPRCGKNIDDNSSLSAFLGSNAKNISPNSVTNLGDHVVLLTGYFDAPTAGMYHFGLESDDGSEMWLNGKVVADNDFDHGLQWVSADADLNAGWNSIEIVQFEDVGKTGLTVHLGDDPIGGALLATVPEPATWAMMILGVGMIGFAARRRRQGVAVAA